MGELLVIYLWPGEALGIHAERGCRSLGTPSPMTSTNFLSLFTFFWLCFATIISRTMHFPYIICHIWSKKQPFTDREFEIGSSWSQNWRTQSISSEMLRARGVLCVQCPLSLPIFLSHLGKISLPNGEIVLCPVASVVSNSLQHYGL